MEQRTKNCFCMDQQPCFVGVLDENVWQGFENESINSLGIVWFKADTQLHYDISACLQTWEESFTLVVFKECSEHVPDWQFELSGPRQYFLQSIHFFEIKFPIMVSVFVLKLSNNPILHIVYLSIWTSSLSLSFLASAFSLNSFSLLSRAAGFFMPLY